MHQGPEINYAPEPKVYKVPDILETDVSTLEGVKEVQRKADKADIEIIEKSVKLRQQEKYKYAFCIQKYATDENRIGSLKNEKGEMVLEDAKKYYQALEKKLEKAGGYTPPKDVKEKVFYDIIFRLKQLGFDKNSVGKALNLDPKNFNDDLVIAILHFQKRAGLTKVEGLIGPETFKALLDDNLTRVNLVKKLPSNADYTYTPVLEGEDRMTMEQEGGGYGFYLLKKLEKELASADELTNTFFSAKNSKKELMRLRASKTLLQKDMAASNIPEAEYEKMLAEVETSISAQEKIVAAFMIEGKGMMNELNTKIANIETGIKDINMRSVKTLEKIKSMREDLGDYYETELQSLKQKRDELMKLNLPTMEIDIDIDWLTNKKDLAILFKQTYFGNREISDFSQRLKEVNQKIETLASKLHPGTNNTAESAKLVENK